VPLKQSERNKAIIRACVLGHKTREEIARVTGLSRGRVAQILKPALKKLEERDISIINVNNTNIPTLEGEDMEVIKEALLAGYALYSPNPVHSNQCP